MARLSKDKYLLLLVDDSAEDCLLIRFALSPSERLHFIGEIWEQEDLVTQVQDNSLNGGRLQMGLPELLQLNFLVPRIKGLQMLEWLQSQPFEDLVVMLLSNTTRPEDIKRVFQLGPEDSAPVETRVTELVEMLQNYLSNLGTKS